MISRGNNPESILPPLGLASIAGFLRKNGHNVSMTDMNVVLANEIKTNGKLPVNIGIFDNPETIEIFDNPKEHGSAGKFIEAKADVLDNYLLGLAGINKPDVIGISSLYTQQLASTLILARHLKEKTGAKSL